MGTTCVLDEPYGVLAEIEQIIHIRQTGSMAWSSSSDLQSAIDTLYALSFLESFRGITDGDSRGLVAILSDAVFEKASNDPDCYFAYCLSVALLVRTKTMTLPKAQKRLRTVLKTVVSKRAEEARIVDGLYGMALFWVVLGEKRAELDKLQDDIGGLAKAAFESFPSFRATEYRVKLLFALSVLPGCAELLNKLYTDRKSDVLGLRKAPLAEALRILLLKPYADLEVECHKSIISEVLIPLRTQKRGTTERNLVHRISGFVLYGHDESSGVSLESGESGSSKLIVELSDDELQFLQEPDMSVRYPSIVGLSLVASGFSRVFVVPGKEREAYTQFRMKMEEEQGLTIRTRKRDLQKLVDRHVALDFKYESLKQALLFIVWILFAGLFGYNVLLFIQGTPLTYVPVLASIIGVLGSSLLTAIKKVPLDLAKLLLARKEHQDKIREDIWKALGTEDGIAVDRNQ